MSRPLSPIVCDGPGCGKQKQEANHWWRAAVSKPLIESLPPIEMVSRPFEIRMWADNRKTNQLRAAWDLFDFCGQTCAIKFISEQMGKAAVQSPVIQQASPDGAQGGQNNG